MMLAIAASRTSALTAAFAQATFYSRLSLAATDRACRFLRVYLDIRYGRYRGDQRLVRKDSAKVACRRGAE
jgi:hypothetical protein